MQKKLFLLISLILLVALSGLAKAESINIRNHSFEYSYDEKQEPNDMNSDTWVLTLGHTGLEEVAAWTNVGNWLGVDTYCPYAEWTPDHCWDIGGELPDEINVLYSQHGKTPPIYFYQVLDHDITDGMMYTLKFDAMAWDDLYYDAVLFWAEPNGAGAEDPANEFCFESIYCGPIALGVDPEDWDIYYFPPENPEIAWGYGPDAFDKTLVYVVDDSPAYVGKKLGIKFYCTGGDSTQYYWGFFDNVRLDGVLATRAYYPSPADKETEVGLEVTELKWYPGLWSDKHDVYFSTNFEAVNSRDPNAHKTPVLLDANSWQLDTTVEIAGVYYWAVDESNDLYSGPIPGPWPGDVWTFYANDGTACKPYPLDRDEMVPVDVVLGWMPGIGATQTGPIAHQVYFGTSFDDVNDANTSDTSGIYRGPQDYDANTYAPQVSSSPTPELILGQDYYWRVDEVNDAHPTKMWKGKVWTFRAADYHLLDDVERYGGSSALKKVWNPGTAGCSEITLETGTARDKKSMSFGYTNWSDCDYFSEVVAETLGSSGSPTDCLLYGPDWTANRAESLALWFYGKKDNSLDDYFGDTIAYDQMYVALDDGISGLVKVQYYGNPNDVRLERWQEWNIGLDEFDGVNLEEVKYLYIGFGTEDGLGEEGGEGTVWFDDVRLYPRRCVPKMAYVTGSFGHLDADCVTDYNDIYALGRDWLMEGHEVSPIEPATPWRWYMLDEGSGTTVYNTGFDPGNDGTLGPDAPDPCDPEWQDETSPTDDWSLYFDAGQGFKDPNGDFVFIPNFHTGTNNLTITAWVKGDAEESEDVLQTGGAGIVWARDTNTNNGTGLCYGWDADWEDNNELLYCWDELYWDWHTWLIIPEQEWAFVAVSIKPGEATVYLNPADSTTLQWATNPAPHHEIVDTGEFLSKLGDDLNGDYMTGSCFWGWMSDVRIYDYALSDEEILYLAQGPTADSFHKMLEKWRADADKDDKVDLMDYAILADYWLEEILFPIP